jgi:hypothetical protein
MRASLEVKEILSTISYSSLMSNVEGASVAVVAPIRQTDSMSPFPRERLLFGHCITALALD